MKDVRYCTSSYATEYSTNIIKGRKKVCFLLPYFVSTNCGIIRAPNNPIAFFGGPGGGEGSTSSRGISAEVSSLVKVVVSTVISSSSLFVCLSLAAPPSVCLSVVFAVAASESLLASTLF
jgi:hypothetical protein